MTRTIPIFRYRSTTKMTPSDKSERLPRLIRQKAQDVPPLHLTARDVAIMQAVYTYRALTSQQLERLFFPPDPSRVSTRPSSQCLRRLKLLFHHGYLLRQEQPQVLSDGRKPLVYWLDKRGAQVVAASYDRDVQDLDWRAGEANVHYPFLEHLLATNDVRIAFMLSAQEAGYTIPLWKDERTLKREHQTDTVLLKGTNGAEQKAAIVPDAYFVLQSDIETAHYCLEVDRRTETVAATAWGSRDWARKIAAYLEYYRSGKYHARYGTQSLRVITVTTGETRLVNLKTTTEESGGRSRFWFTTFAALASGNVITSALWQVAMKEGCYALKRNA